MTEETSPTPPGAAASPPSGDLPDGAIPSAPADPADQTFAAKPPSSDPPPDATAGADGPPPPPPPNMTSTDQRGPWAAQFGLVRPRHGGMLAGVCAGLGRATNTDPVLWRVVLPVLTCLFGLGLLVYIVLWLIMPKEGDTASPIEALFGKGRSSTGTVLTVVLAIGVFLFVGSVTDRFPFLLIVAFGLIIAVLLANRSSRGRPQFNGAGQPGVAYLPPEPPPASYPAASYPAPTAAGPTYPPQPGSGYPAGPPTYPAGYPGSTVTAQLPDATEPPSYRPPFAPHGPFAAPPPPPPPAPVKRKPEPSRLGRLTMGMLLLAIGCLGLVDLAGNSVPFSAYVATSLAVIGLGLIIGAWLGRARGLIALGIIASLMLAMSTANQNWGDLDGQGGTEYYDVVTLDQLEDRYEYQFGEATLDLRQLDFTGQDREVTVEIFAGNFLVLLPPAVDVTVNADVNAGNADVFDREINGAGVSNTMTDLGADGAGGGTLLLNLQVNAGNAEVSR